MKPFFARSASYWAAVYVYPFNHRERNSHFRARTASEKSTAEVNTICHFIAVAALSFSFSYLSGSLLVKASPSIVSVLEALLCLDVGRCCSTRPKSETLRPLVMRGFLLGDSWVLGSHQTVGESFSSPRFNLGGATTTHLTFCSGESAFTSSTLVLAASKEAMASTASSLPATSQQQQPQNTELLLLLMLEQVWDRRPQNSPSIMLVGGQVASSRVLPHHEREIPGPKESEIRSLDWKVRFFLIELSLAFDIMKWWLFNLVFSKFAWQVTASLQSLQYSHDVITMQLQYTHSKWPSYESSSQSWPFFSRSIPFHAVHSMSHGGRAPQKSASVFFPPVFYAVSSSIRAYVTRLLSMVSHFRVATYGNDELF